MHPVARSSCCVRVVSTLNAYAIYTIEPAMLVQDILQEELTEAEAYLAQHAASPVLAGINTRIAVFSGQAAPQILDTAQAEQIDLIVMCSHGSTGIKR